MLNGSLYPCRWGKALEVACGEAYVSSEVFPGFFNEIHLFDQCKHVMMNIVPDKIRQLPSSTMKTFKPKIATIDGYKQPDNTKFDLILFRYCLGYLFSEKEAAYQLYRYKKMLDRFENLGPDTPQTHIIV